MNNVADTGCVLVVVLLAVAVMIGFALRECSAEEDNNDLHGATWTAETRY